MPNKKEVMNKIGKIASKFDYVSAAYVFGSYTHNNDFNDIDVALLISKELNHYERFKFGMQVARELERQIKPRFEFDVKILNHAPIEFQYEVLKKGKAVFLRDKTETGEEIILKKDKNVRVIGLEKLNLLDDKDTPVPVEVMSL